MIFAKHFKAILAAAIVCGAVGFCLSSFVIDKKYTASSLLYVKNTAAQNAGTPLDGVSSAQQSASVSDVIFKSRLMLESVKDDLELECTEEELADMISVESVNATSVIRVSVENSSSKTACEINRVMVSYAKYFFPALLGDYTITQIDEPEETDKPSFPNNSVFIIAGALAGFAVAYIISIASEVMDVSIRQNDDLAEIYNIPVFADIPDFSLGNKTGDYKYSEGYK